MKKMHGQTTLKNLTSLRDDVTVAT